MYRQSEQRETSEQIMGQLNIRIDDELKEAFIRKAKENSTSATELLIDYMKEYLASPQKSESQKIDELERRLVKVEQVLGELAA
jgi:predicted HicB family RNase H-like nuclease